MYYSILCITVQYKDSIIPVGSGVSLSGQLANPHVELTSCPYIILLPRFFIGLFDFSKLFTFHFQVRRSTLLEDSYRQIHCIPSNKVNEDKLMFLYSTIYEYCF